MTENMENWMIQSKKTAFHVTKFQYHLENTIPLLFVKPSISNNQESLIKTKKNDKNMIFHHASHFTQGVSSLDVQTILQSAKKLYVGRQCIKINQNSFKKSKTFKLSYIPVYGVFHQIIQFYIVDRNQSASLTLKNSKITKKFVGNGKFSEETPFTAKSIKKMAPNHFEMYVIHHCQNNEKDSEKKMRWENFIQRYQFIDETIDGEVKPKINYQMILNYQEDSSFSNYFNNQAKLFQSFLGQYLKENETGLQNVNRIQGHLLQCADRVDRKLKELNDPSYQQNHKRWLRLPSEHYKQFTLIKNHVMSYYKSIHQQQKHTQHFLNNLICRYMLAKQYSYKESLEGLLEYLKWEKDIHEGHCLKMYQHIHSLDFFTYLGKDFEGRAVILNKASHLDVDKIKDIDEYCAYYIYYLQIWIQKQLSGYADQYTVIADLEGLGVNNFKLSITKQNISDSLKLCPQRQYKMIVVNVSTFANFAWGFIKPLLPKKTLSKLNIVGNDKKQILEILSKQMDITIIPEYLGGTNNRSYHQDLQFQQKDN